MNILNIINIGQWGSVRGINLIFAILFLHTLIAAIPSLLACIVLSRVPPPYRKQEQGLAFLLLIPFFSLIWMFYVHPRVAQSLRAYFEAHGDRAHGDCGESIAIALCVCSLGMHVPFLRLSGGFAAFILMIVFYAKSFGLSSQTTTFDNTPRLMESTSVKSQTKAQQAP